MALFRTRSPIAVTVTADETRDAAVAVRGDADRPAGTVAVLNVTQPKGSAGSSAEPAKASAWEVVVGIAFFVICLLLTVWPLSNTDVAFSPADGITSLALFYVIALAIERLLEFSGTPIEKGLALLRDKPKAPPDPTKGGPNLKTHRTKPALLNNRDRLVVKAANDPADKDAPANAANAQADVDKATQGRSAALAGFAAGLGVLAAWYLNADFLGAIGVTGANELVSLAVTGLVVAGGSKQLHDFIANISKASKAKDTPAETSPTD